MIDENGTLDLTGIKEINQNDYSNNKKLKKLIIGNTLEEMGEYSFCGCENLEEIDFSNTILKEISKRCFQSCLSLKSINLPSSIKSIRDWAFPFCPNLESIILEDVNEIGFEAFSYCYHSKDDVNLEKIYIFLEKSKNENIKITCPDKYVDYFKKRFPKSEINNDYQYVLK